LRRFLIFATISSVYLKITTEHPGAPFSALPREAQRAFLTYEFSVDLLIDAADADVLDIFCPN